MRHSAVINETALDSDFDPALSHRLRLDHGSCIPLWRIGVDAKLPIVPLLVNDLEAPMLNIKRCLAWAGCSARRSRAIRSRCVWPCSAPED